MAVAAALLGLGVVLVTVGARGHSFLPDVTGESRESAHGWVLVLCGLVVLLVSPHAMAAISGGRGWTLMGLAGLGAGLLVASAAAVAGADRVSTLSTVIVGVAASVALRWDRPTLPLLRLALVAVVLVAVLLMGRSGALVGPVAALVAVGLADEVSCRVGGGPGQRDG